MLQIEKKVQQFSRSLKEARQKRDSLQVVFYAFSYAKKFRLGRMVKKWESGSFECFLVQFVGGLMGYFGAVWEISRLI